MVQWVWVLTKRNRSQGNSWGVDETNGTRVSAKRSQFRRRQGADGAEFPPGDRGLRRHFSRMDWRQCAGVELHLEAMRPKAGLCPMQRPRSRVFGRSDGIRDSLVAPKLRTVEDNTSPQVSKCRVRERSYLALE